MDIEKSFKEMPKEVTCPECGSDKSLGWAAPNTPPDWGNIHGLAALKIKVSCRECGKSSYTYWGRLDG